MQNAHTRKTAYTFFLYFITDPQRKPNRDRTELEKSIPHIPKTDVLERPNHGRPAW